MVWLIKELDTITKFPAVHSEQAIPLKLDFKEISYLVKNIFNQMF